MEQSSAYPSATRHRRALVKLGALKARVQRYLEFVTSFDCTLEYCKGSGNGIADFSGPFSRACYGVQQQWLDKLQPRGVDELQPCWR